MLTLDGNKMAEALLSVLPAADGAEEAASTTDGGNSKGDTALADSGELCDLPLLLGLSQTV